MTLLFCDSFDHYTTITQKYASSSTNGSGATATISSSGGRFGNGLFFSNPNGGGGEIVTLNLSPSTDVVFVGHARRFNALPSSGNMILVGLKESATYHLELRISTTGILSVTRNGSALTGATGTTTLSVNTFYYIEFKAVIADGTGGSVEVRVNGATEINAGSLDTRNGGTGVIDQYEFANSGTNSSGAQHSIDDIYICDDNGSTNNTFLGDVRVQAIFPSGNGNSSQLVGSDSNSTDNYLLVDETVPDDADYVESSTVGEKDTYAYGNVTPTTGTVYGLQVMTRAAKTDAGTRSVASIARLSGTEVDSSDKTLSTTYAYLPDIRETKPGGGAWSISDVNSAEFGVKVTA